MPRRLMYGELQTGQRNQGIKTRSKPISSGATSVRETWRDMPWKDKMVRLGSQSCCHQRAALAVITKTDFQCPYCSRHCASGLGLRSHLRVHRWVAKRKRHYPIWRTTTIYIDIRQINKKKRLQCMFTFSLCSFWFLKTLLISFADVITCL